LVPRIVKRKGRRYELGNALRWEEKSGFPTKIQKKGLFSGEKRPKSAKSCLGKEEGEEG